LAEVRTSEASSCGERAELSSSAGSIPNRCRIQLAVPLVSRINGVTAAETNTWGPATTRAVCSGTAMARYCATNSPNTMENDVATTRAAINATPSIQPAGTPTAVSTGASSLAITGSAR
jgi:hypothetical protein